MSYLHCLSHLLLNSNGAADSKETKNCQESWVIELPLNECPELSVVFLATKKPNQNKIFRNSQDWGDPSEAPVEAASAGGVKKELFAFSSFSFIVMKEPSHFHSGETVSDQMGGQARIGREAVFQGAAASLGAFSSFSEVQPVSEESSSGKRKCCAAWELTGCPSSTNN